MEGFTMGVSLQKGQKVDLTKGNPSLSKIIVGLGWDIKRYDGGFDFDLDASAFMLGSSDKVTSESDFIFYNNLKSKCGSVQHTGDNLTGEGEGDDEQIIIEMGKVPQTFQKIAITVTIHDPETRKQNFGMISNAFVRIVDEATGQELIRYDLGEDFSIETAIVVAEIYRYNDEWKFAAVGSGFKGGLGSLCSNFGIQT
jgi:tellurium resistance protein TerD